ncbi:PAS domain S-box protein [Anaerobacillus alkaliphilus]|uniref:histidine kinase n=1 Tax=Anaerobacillus alkaliphilus TaxID=1548597 RepID=A0A4Q0W006_9BACI|nr:PAS domain S-box protein [Anaerobacillus alkaliphilus]RXJ04548.1 PAS domain S-box protein [Anaerobacillus alkaliphilus]
MRIQKLDTLEILDRITDCFYMLDLNWNFSYVNINAANLFHRSKEELLGKCLWEMFPEVVHLPIYHDFHFAMVKQKPIHIDFYYPPEKLWFDVRAYPSDEGLSVYFLDITACRRSSIQTSQYYESLFINNPEAVCCFNLEGRFVDVNKGLEELTGYTEQELFNLDFQSLVVDEDLERTNMMFKRAIKGEAQNYEIRIRRKSGRIIHIKATDIPITLDDEVVGVFGIAKDITLQKLAEENIENSEKLSLVGQLSASIAHEIRNPLTTLKGFLQLIQENNEIAPNYISIMLSEMDRIELITSELLLLAKPQAAEFQEESIGDIIHNIVTLLQSQALMKNIEITFSFEEVGKIYCVSNQIKQVFINILKNAVEAMDQGGIIHVKLSNIDKYTILIEVIDQGCGIPDDVAPYIGLPFYSTKEKGTGLGMLTTYKLVNDHGGKISFVSKEGEGTTFKIQLPRKTIKVDEKFMRDNA